MLTLIAERLHLIENVMMMATGNMVYQVFARKYGTCIEKDLREQEVRLNTRNDE
jgi:hypothetical protein